MPRFDVRHLSFLAWAVVSAGLVAVIGDQVGWGDRLRLGMPVAEVLDPDAVGVDLLGEYSLPSLEKQYPLTLSRPLFVPTRRPPPPPPPPPPPQPPPKPTMQKGQFQFVGAIILPETSYVVLRDVASGKTRRVEKGQTINGILIESVEPDRVTLTQYDDVEVVTMKVQPSGKGAPAAPGAAPAPSARPARAVAPQAPQNVVPRRQPLTPRR